MRMREDMNLFDYSGLVRVRCLKTLGRICDVWNDRVAIVEIKEGKVVYLSKESAEILQERGVVEIL